MGFTRGGKGDSKGHTFVNDPDSRHQKCVKCGMRRIKVYSNSTGKITISYYDAFGNYLEGFPRCKQNDIYAELFK